MKKIKTKLSNLHKLFNVEGYESEFFLEEDILIETLDGDYEKINALVKKRTEMIECAIEGIDEPYVCAKKHIIMTPEGWKFMQDAEFVTFKNGEALRVLSKKDLGVQDAYDVALSAPHVYVTANGLVHHNTCVALYRALEEVLDKSNNYKTLVIVRSAVQTRDQGHLPGSLEEKQEIFEQPYREICQFLFGRPDAYQRLKEQGAIRFITTTAIRGISLDDSIVLFDECQNANFGELASVLTRVGHRSKFIMAGDKFQNDLTKNSRDVSGLGQFLEILETMSEFEPFYFTSADIVRSSLVKSFIVACEKKGVIPS